MARKKISPEEQREIERVREIKKKAKNRKSGLDGEGDNACAICDDGGSVTCCDGGCQRCFHLADEKDEDAKCRLKLGVTKEQAKMIIEGKEKFICKNCKYNQHQCSVCGLLGSSDLSSQPRVFQCEHDDCGHFYHPKCVAKLLYPDCELKAELFEVEIFAGQKFTCPMHECIKCRGGENKDDSKMQFAVCRRCPTVYHRGCLPSDILFPGDCPKGVMPRAWDKVLHGRILFYCKRHEIVKKLGTPKRNHIIFPEAKKIRVPKMLAGPPMEQDKPEEGELLGQQPIEQDKPEEEELLDQQLIEQDKPEEQELLDQQPIEQDKAEKEELVDEQPIEQDKHKEEELLDKQPMPKGSQSRPPATKNECSCCGHSNSFARKALFMHPQPGSCGWLDE